MKSYKFDIPEYFINKFFQPIRSKLDVLLVLLNALDYIILNPDIVWWKFLWKILLQIDKMSRLFFFIENKYFSISFPFLVRETNEWRLEFFMRDTLIDQSTISSIKTIIYQLSSDGYSLLDFLSNDSDNNYDASLARIINELILIEDWYIRYDYDEISYLEHVKKGTWDNHPPNHYDLFYSNRVTFKIWLKSKLREQEFVDFLDRETKCIFLE